MQYRKGAGGKEWSALGFGCMRFPRNGNSIDTDATEKIILRAAELGVNYFDTAYIYPGSEECLGTILEKNGIREKVMIATKLPQYMISSPAAIEKYFQEQCRRLKTDYIDQYLMHMLTDLDAWHKLCSLGIREWIDEKSMLIRWALYMALFLAVLLLGVYGPSYDPTVFIYREF